YTNAVARKNLEFAVLASRRLGRVPDPKWSRVAERLHVPYDSAGQYHPTYEGAPPETRGSVVPLPAYPLGLPMSERARRNDRTAVRRNRVACGVPSGAAVADHAPHASKRRLARPSLRCGRRGRFRPLRPAMKGARRSP